MRIALVTGASSGLGREFVKRISETNVKNIEKNRRRIERGKDPLKKTIDEIWVVARREDRLRNLSEVCPVSVRIFALDLTECGAFDVLKKVFEKEQPEIGMLISAAGFARIARADRISIEDADGMIDLNCRAAVDITTVSLPYMKKGSQIIQICSTAGFQPLPNLSVYSATKAFLITYTKTLHHELISKGIHVTAVCPYWIKDTEFIGKAEKTDKKGYGHYLFASKSKNVVRWSLFDSRLNMWVSTPGPVCFVHRIFAKFVPHCVLTPLMELIKRI